MKPPKRQAKQRRNKGETVYCFRLNTDETGETRAYKARFAVSVFRLFSGVSDITQKGKCAGQQPGGGLLALCEMVPADARPAWNRMRRASVGRLPSPFARVFFYSEQEFEQSLAFSEEVDER